MRIFRSIRGTLLFAVGLCATVAAQPLPATPPTSAATVTAAPQAKNAPLQPAQQANVSFTAGMLSVTAENSSLNQILREIGRVTGMKITGGVTDERVYGSYGPADTGTVLTTLLKGTGSNMMLVFDERRAPQELVLTPRGGGPTPPNPNASRARDEDDLPPQRRERNPQQNGFNPSQVPHPPNQVQPNLPPQPPAAQITPTTPQTTNQINPPPTVPGTDTTQQSPNGVKTPQEIYDQLMKLQQQQKTPTPPQ